MGEMQLGARSINARQLLVTSHKEQCAAALPYEAARIKESGAACG